MLETFGIYQLPPDHRVSQEFRTLYAILYTRDYYSKRLHMWSRDWQVHFKGLENIEVQNCLGIVGKILENLMTALMEKCKPTDDVRFVLQSPVLDTQSLYHWYRFRRAALTCYLHVYLLSRKVKKNCASTKAVHSTLFMWYTLLLGAVGMLEALQNEQNLT